MGDEIDGDLFPDMGPIIRYDFEGTADQPIFSSGSDTLEVTLRGGARRMEGALQLPQNDGDYDHALSVGAADAVTEACVNEKGLTMVAWVTPRGTVPLESTPARIVSIENLEAGRTSLTLGQFDSQTNHQGFVARIGPTRQIEATPYDYPENQALFLFFTINIDGEYVFQVGEQVEAGTASSLADLWDWDLGHRLSVGGSNDGKRPFQGQIHHVEIYCREMGSVQRLMLKNATDPG